MVMYTVQVHACSETSKIKIPWDSQFVLCRAVISEGSMQYFYTVFVGRLSVLSARKHRTNGLFSPRY